MSYTREQMSFINEAREAISDDSSSRLSPKVKEILANGNYVFDAHTHVFDGGCIDTKYFLAKLIEPKVDKNLLRLLKAVLGDDFFVGLTQPSNDKILDEIYENIDSKTFDDLDTVLNKMEKVLQEMEEEVKVDGESLTGVKNGFIKRIREIIDILKLRSMMSVYDKLKNNYGVHTILNANDSQNRKLIPIVLGMNLTKGWDSNIPKTWEVQNSELLTLSEKEPIIPFFPIDPREENLYNEFLNAFKEDNYPKFYGVKCYPALGYLPADPILLPIFEICAEKNIPVMTHCGGESISTYDSPVVVNRLDKTVTFSDNKRKIRARHLNEPSEWKPVLEKFENLRLCFGHFGGTNAWRGKRKTSERVSIILEIMKDYNNVHADFSYNISSTKATKNFYDKIKQEPIINERAMFGTDFWVIMTSVTGNLIKTQKQFIKINKDLLDNLLKINVLKYLNITEKGEKPLA